MNETFTWLSLVACLTLGACKTEPKPPEVPSTQPTAELDQSFRTERPAALPPAPFEHPAPALAQLGNGFSLWLLERPSTTLSLRVVCRAGSRDNPPQKSGLAAFTSRLLTEGSRSKTSLELALAVEELGASLVHDSGRDASSVGLEVLPEHEERAITLLAEIVRAPGLRNADVTRVRAEWLDDLRAQRQDPGALAWLVGMRALLGPELGASTRGTPAHVTNLSAEDVQRFHAAHYEPSRCGLLAVGPSTMGALEAFASDGFGDWPMAKPKPARRPAVPSPPAQITVYLLDRPDAVQTAVFAGNLVPPRYAEGHEVRQVLDNLFGGLFTSRINTNLRETHGYTYGAFSSLMTSQDFGIWAISTSVRSEVTDPAVEQIALELQRLARGTDLTQDELDRSRTDLSFKNDSRLEHSNLLLDELEEAFVYEIPSEYFSHYRTSLEAITLPDLAKELPHVPMRGMVIALVGDQRKLADVARFAHDRRQVGMQWLDGQ